MGKNIQSFLVRLLVQFGPALLAGLIILALSGGFPPSNWRILLLTLFHYSAYQEAQGSSLRTPLVILWVQSILLALVWLVWLILLLREFLAFLRGAPQTVPTHSSALAVPQPLPVTTSASAARNASNAPQNPFEDLAHQRLRTGTITLGKAAEAKKEQQRKIQLALASAKPAAPIPAVSTEQLPSPARVKSETVSPASTPARPINPFDVQSDIMDSFEPPDLIAAAPVSGTSPGHKEEATSSAFVFGDPFEGELPEVFEYDADLKLTVAEMKQKDKQSS